MLAINLKVTLCFSRNDRAYLRGYLETAALHTACCYSMYRSVSVTYP
jgi:hypothetical protein